MGLTLGHLVLILGCEIPQLIPNCYIWGLPNLNPAISFHHITSHLISSHHITSHHITSHHITSHLPLEPTRTLARGVSQRPQGTFVKICPLGPPPRARSHERPPRGGVP